MSSRRWKRIAAAGGIGFVVMWVAGYMVALRLSGSLAYDAPTQEVARYFAAHETPLLLGVSISAIGIFFLFGFVASLWAALGRSQGEAGWLSALALGGGSAASAVLLAQQTVLRAASVEALDPVAVHALFILFNVFQFGAVFSFAVLLAATALLILRTQTFPRWLGWISAALALLFLGPGGFYPWLAFPLFLLWVLATSVVLMRRAAGVSTLGGA